MLSALAPTPAPVCAGSSPAEGRVDIRSFLHPIGCEPTRCTKVGNTVSSRHADAGLTLPGKNVSVNTGTRRLSTTLAAAAAASAGAGLVHAAAAGSHSDDTTL